MKNKTIFFMASYNKQNVNAKYVDCLYLMRHARLRSEFDTTGLCECKFL